MTTNITGHIDGIDKLVTYLNTLGNSAMPAMGLALHDEGEEIMRVSAGYVPVKSGALRGTGFVDKPVFVPDGVTIRLHYGGGPAKDYAVKQHEDLTLHHPTGGKAKYLELPFLHAMTGLGERLAVRVGAILAW
jgi:hypothetical protein